MNYLFMYFEASVLLGEHTFRIAVSSWKTEASVIMWYLSLSLGISLFWSLLCQILMQPLQPLLMSVSMLCLFSSIYCTCWCLYIYSVLRVFEVNPWPIPDVLRALSAQGGSSVFESASSSRSQALEARWGPLTSSPYLWAQNLALSGRCTGVVTSAGCEASDILTVQKPEVIGKLASLRAPIVWLPLRATAWIGAPVSSGAGGDGRVWSAGLGAAVS